MHILWVEDNERMIVAARRFLAGHEVTVAESLADARHCLATASFELVLLDYDLPDGKGCDLFDAIRAASPTPAVVAASSHAVGNAALMDAGCVVTFRKADFARIQPWLERFVAAV